MRCCDRILGGSPLSWNQVPSRITLPIGAGHGRWSSRWYGGFSVARPAAGANSFELGWGETRLGVGLVSLRELLSGFVQQMGGTGPALLSSCRFPSRLAAWGRVCWFGLLAWVFGLGFRPGFSSQVLGLGSWRGFLAWILGVDSWCGGGLVFFPGFFGRLLPADWWGGSLFPSCEDARARLRSAPRHCLHRGRLRPGECR